MPNPGAQTPQFVTRGRAVSSASGLACPLLLSSFDLIPSHPAKNRVFDAGPWKICHFGSPPESERGPAFRLRASSVVKSEHAVPVVGPLELQRVAAGDLFTVTRLAGDRGFA